MKISFAKLSAPTRGVVVVTVASPGKPKGKGKKAGKEDKAVPVLGRIARALDDQTNGALLRAIGAMEFTGARGKTLQLPAPDARLDRVVLLGLGDPKSLDEPAAERLGAAAYDAVVREPSATLVLEDLPAPKAAKLAVHVAGGARLKSYRFDKYRTKEGKDAKPKLKSLEIQSQKPTEAARAYKAVDAVVEGVFFTRDLVNEPANVLYPESFANRAKALSRDGLKVEVLDEPALKRLRMGALLGVGQGSARSSCVLVMRWNGARSKSAPPVALVGKGVCFDSGGISIKPAGGMWDMKWDMGGAGTVVGAMQALAKRKARVNVVGLCGLVENMPDGLALRPGDVVTSMSGQTIEVQNTDAEGRLVLADVLWYAQEKFQPCAIVDLATLTGAVIAALAEHYAGLFSNNDKLANQLTAAGKAVGERLWRFPMGEEYDKQLKSMIADMKNIGGPRAGSITAAQFLQRFVKDETPWAHLDIAGVVWSEKGTPLAAPGSTSYGVRLLNRFIADNYES